MIKYIKRFSSHYFKFPQQRYQISSHAFSEFIELTPNAQRLFVNILNSLDKGPKKVIIKITYKDLGYKHYSNLYRDRLQLINRQFIIFDNNQYFINPCMVNPYNRRQWTYLKSLLNITKNINANFGVPSLPTKNK